MILADAEKEDSEKVVSKVCEKLTKRTVQLNFALFCRYRTEKFPCSLFSESINVVSAVAQHL